MSSLTAWPNTHNQPPPSDHLYRSVVWLLGRHPFVADLAARCPGVVYWDLADDELTHNVDLLADGLDTLDRVNTEFRSYLKRHPVPRDSSDPNYDAWDAASPQLPDTPEGKVAKSIAPMSGSERIRLELLAAFSYSGARLKVSDFGRLDTGGTAFLADWMTAAMAA